MFLSYASQDAEEAKRICDSLRAAGIEVWFDQNELVGGDAWDAKIRKQIASCALFVPIISANTQARAEGYFRLEWKLAVDRSHLMADDQPFLFPVVIDDTSDALARVPERFRERQWMRLDLKDSPESLAARVSQLLAHHPPNDPAATPPHPARRRPPVPSTRPAWLRAIFILFGLGLAAFYGVWPMLNRPASIPDVSTPPPAPAPTAPLTEAGRLVERAEAILDGAALTRELIETAHKLLEQAITLEPNHAAAWAQAARADVLLIFPYRYDRTSERRQQAMTRATRAFNLAPGDFPTRIIFETVMAHASDNPGLIREAEAWFRAQLSSHPNDNELSVRLADILREQSRYEEAAAVFTQAGESELAGWSWHQAGDHRAAYVQVKQAAETRPSPSVYTLKALIEMNWFQDLDQAQASFAQLRSSEMFNELVAPNAIIVSFYRRDWDNLLTLINALPRDYIESAGYTGPKQYFAGWAHRLSGREARARIEWEKALALLQAQSAAQPEREQLIVQQATLEALLQRPDEARRLLQVAVELSGQPPEASNALEALLTYLALRDDERVLAIAERILREKTGNWIDISTDARFAPNWDHLRGNPRFEKLLRETAPADAKPFDRAAG